MIETWTLSYFVMRLWILLKPVLAGFSDTTLVRESRRTSTCFSQMEIEDQVLHLALLVAEGKSSSAGQRFLVPV